MKPCSDKWDATQYDDPATHQHHPCPYPSESPRFRLLPSRCRTDGSPEPFVIESKRRDEPEQSKWSQSKKTRWKWINNIKTRVITWANQPPFFSDKSYENSNKSVNQYIFPERIDSPTWSPLLSFSRVYYNHIYWLFWTEQIRLLKLDSRKHIAEVWAPY